MHININYYSHQMVGEAGKQGWMLVIVLLVEFVTECDGVTCA